MNSPQFRGIPFQVTGTGISTITATKAASTGLTHFITDISASTDLSGGTLVVKDGSTVIWQERVSSNSPYQHTFCQPLYGSAGAAVSATMNGSLVTFVNMAGYSI